jgi:hypothetical protein
MILLFSIDGYMKQRMHVYLNENNMHIYLHYDNFLTFFGTVNNNLGIEILAKRVTKRVNYVDGTHVSNYKTYLFSINDSLNEFIESKVNIHLQSYIFNKI